MNPTETAMSHDVADFQRDVIERSRTVPVLADFWAAWCGPCRVLGPVLERLAAGAQDRWVLAKVDTEAHPEEAMRYGVQSIPNVKLFVDGQVVDEFVGALPEGEIRRWLGQALPSPLAAEVEAAAGLLAQRDWAAAAARLRAVLESEPGNRRARLLLGEALLHTDPAAVEGALRDLEDDADVADQVDALWALARAAATAERAEALPAGAGREPYLAGARAVRAGDYAAALEAFVESLRRQRDFADGAAKEAGRAVFVLLGHAHPISERFLRAFSSALHV